VSSRTVGVYTENTPGERRVALVPTTVQRIRDLGLDVLVEECAGAAAGFPDSSYAAAGARILSRPELLDTADILTGVRAPINLLMHRFRRGQALICLLQPLQIPALIRQWADQGLTTIAVDLLPPAFTRANPIDAASADYAATIADLLDHLVHDGALMIDLADSIQARIVVTHGRNVLNDAVWQLILAEIAIAGLP
jgi:NAD(P) transhydrogenase subunit alpha